MAWSDLVPILTEEMVDAARGGITGADRARYDDLFAVEEVVNPSPGDHVLSASLFCKTANSADGDIVEPSEDFLRDPAKFGVALRYNPWEHYVAPILDWAPELSRAFPRLAIRVYLAADMAFLAGRFAEASCEVRIMGSSSIRSAPGMLWRLLALEDSPSLTTVTDADLFASAARKIQVTEALEGTELGFWRVPVAHDFNEGVVHYRAMAGCYWGTRLNLPVAELLRAHLWHLEQGTAETCARHPVFPSRKGVMIGATWPDYGADEFFLTTAIYPRLARSGCLTVISARPRSRFLPLDIEYVTWSNPASEVNHQLYRSVTRCTPEEEKRQEQFQDRLRAKTGASTGGDSEPLPHPERPRNLHFCRASELALPTHEWQFLTRGAFDFATSLPFADDSFDRIFAENIIEMLPIGEAVNFFAECRRVLRPSGTLRVVFIDVPKLWQQADSTYLESLKQRGIGDGRRDSAVLQTVLGSEHATCWTVPLVQTLLASHGFETTICEPNQSADPFLENLEGRRKIALERDSRVDTSVVETTPSDPEPRDRTAPPT